MYGTPDQVKQMTGVKPDDFKNIVDETALNAMLTTWLEWISGAIDTKLIQGAIAADDPKYPMVELIAVTRCAKMVNKARKYQVDDMATSDEIVKAMMRDESILEGLSKELAPLQSHRVSVFMAGDTTI